MIWQKVELLLDTNNFLKQFKNIILASQSPRRKSLLKLLGLNNVEIYKHSINEDNFELKRPLSKSILDLAEQKASSVKKKINKKIIIAGDTVVFRAGQVFNKTNSQKEVKKYLKSLSGRKHFVYGGLCVISSKGTIFRRFVKTEVYFNKIDEREMTNEITEIPDMTCRNMKFHIWQ